MTNVISHPPFVILNLVEGSRTDNILDYDFCCDVVKVIRPKQKIVKLINQNALPILKRYQIHSEDLLLVPEHQEYVPSGLLKPQTLPEQIGCSSTTAQI